MPDLFSSARVTFAELAAECRREVSYRRSVYGRLVDRGRMTGEHARYRIAVMAEAERLFQAEAERADQASEPAQ